MKKFNYAETTIAVTDRRLGLIAKSVDLYNFKEVTKYLANKQAKTSYIESLANAYYWYARFNNIKIKKSISV